ncbi:glycosyltransferase family 2 protein [Candidatus Nucleicultrix amoebiphila]|jgi:glycosyltransferase involved in cell wall biosynthesis|uniref:Glycosyltransferase 2-like domain-containing protein n=1 Tax=Candidatus Nucleicultrix amoebiphila FS5 TaxID=1414854 RepID=A0A1W6N5K9_9PROT|nr:glycosyltransferase [Candidatus Nucleicultrix amoebiphila]ARN85049.1 hypothetical protein GQ61_06830 [Candidatus Nucleicultrix amoebiphila FS5]
MNKNSLPLVSIVIATFNRAPLLKETLQSVISQTYKNLEIIVVGDGCTDNTEEVVANLNDTRIHYFEITHAGRPAVPRNFGAMKAKGNYIAFCDDDDIWVNTKIEKQLAVFLCNPELGLVYTGFSNFTKNTDFSEVVNLDKTSFEKQLYRNRIAFSTIMISKKILHKIQGFDERAALKASEDYLFVLKIVACYPFFFLNEPLLKYRVHAEGISSTKNSVWKLFKYYIRLLICFFECYKLRYLSFSKLIFMGLYHFKHVSKMILFTYFQSFKNIWCLKR